LSKLPLHYRSSRPSFWGLLACDGAQYADELRDAGIVTTSAACSPEAALCKASHAKPHRSSCQPSRGAHHLRPMHCHVETDQGAMWSSSTQDQQDAKVPVPRREGIRT